MNEKEMREAKVPWLKSEGDLVAYINGLVDQEHDYGTCVYAMSMAATATFNYVAGRLGVTGFQASCADMDILRRTRGWEWGKILDYSKLLYPQYLNEEEFPDVSTLMANPEIRDRLKTLAGLKLADEHSSHAAERVRAHWEMLASWEGDDR